MEYKQFVSRLFVYLKEHIGKLIFVSLMMILATALESSIPEITGRIVDDLFVEDRNTQDAVLYASILFGVFVLSSIFALTSTAASSWVSNKVIQISVLTCLLNF